MSDLTVAIGECKEGDCKKPLYRRGLCTIHYRVWRKENVTPVIKICSNEDCDRRVLARGLCNKHYAKWRRDNKDLPRCKEPNCAETVLSREMCSKHYIKWRKTEGLGDICQEDHCDRPAFLLGWCEMHHGRVRRHGTPERIIGFAEGECVEEDCFEAVVCKERCSRHYNRWNAEQRMAESPSCIEKGCEEIQASITSRGRCQKHFREFARARTIMEHGITPKRFDEMLEEQRDHCRTCPATEPGGRGSWCIDHDHNHCPGSTGCAICVRGLLCNGCNRGIGSFRDNPASMMAAAEYVQYHAMRILISQLDPHSMTLANS